MKIYESDKIFFIGIILGILIGIAVFMIIMGIYENKNENSQYDGCWKEIKSGKSKGDWVCVNIKDMNYERALEVVSHEIGHEIFAEECEKNITKCFNVVEYLK